MSMVEMQEIRRSKQPPGLSCGSYFTNPPNTSAGKLIDQAGLKGLSIGGVQISPHHANFFVSRAGARWQDVLEIAEIAKSKVREQFQIQLHEEVRIIT
jgi:UDP-N-acetylmuramate dehydrogenase